MPEETLVYEQPITVSLTRVDLDYRCDITGDETADDAAWAVTATEPTRGKAFTKALALARHEMRLEVDEA